MFYARVWNLILQGGDNVGQMIGAMYQVCMISTGYEIYNFQRLKVADMKHNSHIALFRLIDLTTWRLISGDPDRLGGCWFETIIEDLTDETPTLISCPRDALSV